MIAFLGMGHLGGNFVQALIRQGAAVQVWNRTFSKAQALEQFGAVACQEVGQAVSGANRIHITLKDDAAIDEVLALAKPHLQAGATLIDHTTTSKQGAIDRTAYWAKEGFTYLHAPVFMGPINALESTGSMLVSGDQAIIATWTPHLSKMTGTLINLGTETGKAAAMKLVGNLFLVGMTGALSDALLLAKATGANSEDVANLFGGWNPAAMLPARLKKITSKSYDQPTWELHMARKDVRLMLEEAAKNNTTLSIIPGMATIMDSYIAQGHGHDDWTVIAKDSI